MVNDRLAAKRLFFILLMLSVASLDAAAPTIAAKTGSHYVLAQPNMATIIPVCTKLQQDVYNFLVTQKTLLNIGLSRSFGYEYKNADFNVIKPHISLLPIPSTFDVEGLRGLLATFLGQYPKNKMPTSFTFKNVEAFLPNPGSTRIFIVARTSSNVSYGFMNLSKDLEQQLGITNPQQWFLGHISLGTLVTNKPAGFTQQDVAKINSQLKNFLNIPKGQYAIDAIILSPYKQNKTIQLWP